MLYWINFDTHCLSLAVGKLSVDYSATAVDNILHSCQLSSQTAELCQLPVSSNIVPLKTVDQDKEKEM